MQILLLLFFYFGSFWFVLVFRYFSYAWNSQCMLFPTDNKVLFKHFVYNENVTRFQWKWRKGSVFLLRASKLTETMSGAYAKVMHATNYILDKIFEYSWKFDSMYVRACVCGCVVRSNVSQEIKFDSMQKPNENKSNGQNLHIKRACCELSETKIHHCYELLEATRSQSLCIVCVSCMHYWVVFFYLNSLF